MKARYITYKCEKMQYLGNLYVYLFLNTKAVTKIRVDLNNIHYSFFKKIFGENEKISSYLSKLPKDNINGKAYNYIEKINKKLKGVRRWLKRL